MNHPSFKKFPDLVLVFAGVGAAITTTSHASEAPPLLAIQPAGLQSNRIELGFEKPQGRQLFVEESRNLSQWNFLDTFPHSYRELPGVGHDPMQILLGDQSGGLAVLSVHLRRNSIGGSSTE